ncbi:MAG: PAS domain-containing protein [Actinobacteria bacterium]|nr:PAS domain-containing protein [Actinomycetota bacterium]
MESFLSTYELGDGAKDALRAQTLDALYQGVVVTDPSLPDNPIVYANEAFLALTGYDRDEIVGFNCRFLQGPGTSRAMIDRLRADIRDEEPFFGEILNYRKDGSTFWNALSITPLRNDVGDVTHFVASQTDVTPLKELQLRSEQQQRLELLGTFAGGIAHDFNNVLTAVAGYSELLARDPGGESAARYTTQIGDAAATGQRLTRQLLSFSKGEGAAVRGPIDACRVAAETAALVSRLLPAGIKLAVDLPDCPVIAQATHSQLEQVLLNLVVNARDAIDGRGEIWLGVCEDATHAVITVADDGCGMTPEVQERIFEAFFTTKAPGLGTGLGLATINGIVHDLGGTITVESTVGSGTTFRVALRS